MSNHLRPTIGNSAARERTPKPTTLRHILNDTRRYRNSIRTAFAAPATEKETSWNHSHNIARALIERYGAVTFARIDDIAFRYS